MPLAHLDPFARHPLVFLTVCTAQRSSVLANAIAHSILAELWRDSLERNGWCVGRFVVMPDHIHLFAMPAEKPQQLSKWIAVWKAISARQIIAKTGASAPIWQRDHFDRYLRTTESYGKKWDYVCNNPVHAKLVSNSDEWPYQGIIHELRP
jgi:REP element-mobilizing transposase RayT